MIHSPRSFRSRVAAALLLALLPALPAAAAPAPPARDDPAARTRADVEAIDAWVRGAYAGAVDPDDRAFGPVWQAAVTLARERAATVRDADGGRFVLRALVHAARDGHVILRERAPPAAASWAGLALERRGTRYLARRPADAPADVDTRIADGAVLLGCDGQPADAVLAARLDLFETDWRIQANRSRHASRLFLDTGNPYVARPQRCRFEAADGVHEIALTWTPVDRTAWAAAVRPFERIKRQADRIALDHGADRSAWITLGNLHDYRALSALTAQVARERSRIEAAPYLVFDLRGNGGGDSSLADALARALWGAESSIALPEPARPKRWRASPLTLEAVAQVRAEVAALADPNPGLLRMADGLLDVLGAAIDAGIDLVVDPDAQRLPERPPSAQPARRAPASRQPVYVLTDGGCFSSCIIATYLLKRQGARQAGDPTGVHTIYGEVWFSRRLPNLDADLIVPLAINTNPPDQLGGDPPELPWTGAAEDEAGLRAMIAADAASRRAAQAPPRAGVPMR